MQKISNTILRTPLYLICLSCLILFQSCASDKNIIDKNQMAQIISQMYLADTYRSEERRVGKEC